MVFNNSSEETCYRHRKELRALVVELVDTRDLKSLGVRAVPVQVRPGAPSNLSLDNKNMARWQSGYAADCKSVDLGSTPGRASTICDTSSAGRAQPCQG